VTLAATAAFRAGESSLTDLLDGLRAASAARLGEIDLREQALAAHRELEAALGRPLVGGGF
jgi:outer membrane protein TolC